MKLIRNPILPRVPEVDNDDIAKWCTDMVNSLQKLQEDTYDELVALEERVKALEP
jgi:hypothetical protein